MCGALRRFEGPGEMSWRYLGGVHGAGIKFAWAARLMAETLPLSDIQKQVRFVGSLQQLRVTEIRHEHTELHSGLQSFFAHSIDPPAVPHSVPLSPGVLDG